MAAIPSVGVRRLPASDISAFCLFVAIQVWLIFSHPPWIDEGQALLIARAPLDQLFFNLKYEGHGALWYLWLGMVDRLAGGTAWSLPIAQLPISIGLLYLIWFRSPFTWPARVLLSLNYFFIFEYGVISREYSLGAFLILYAIAERESLLGWIALALAANTSVYDTAGAGVLAVVLFFRRPRLVGPLIVMAGVLAAALTVFPIAPDLHPTAGNTTGSWLVRFLRGEQMMSNLVVPAVPTFPYQWRNTVPGWWGVAAGALALPFGLMIARQRAFRWGFAGLYVIFLLFAMAIHEVLARDAGVMFLLLLGSLWIALDEGERLAAWSWTWLAWLAVCGLPFAATSSARPFTHSRIIAQWITAHGLRNQTWGAWPGREGTMISTEFGRPTINLEKDCLNTFLRWDYPHEFVADPLEHIRADGTRYVISEIRLAEGRLLASFPIGGGWEWQTYLYAFDVQPRPVRNCR
ncbi:MAG TPA: hypothetical protein VG166_04810 [Caulobacteraceae bacterium]|nr:hypothetical protein [Caulobacteraceae bacterium]